MFCNHCLNFLFCAFFGCEAGVPWTLIVGSVIGWFCVVSGDGFKIIADRNICHWQHSPEFTVATVSEAGSISNSQEKRIHQMFYWKLELMYIAFLGCYIILIYFWHWWHCLCAYRYHTYLSNIIRKAWWRIRPRILIMHVRYLSHC